MPEFLPTLFAGLAIFLVIGLALTFPQNFGSQSTGAVLAATNGNGLDYLIVAERVALRTNEILKLSEENITVDSTQNHFSTFYFKPENYDSAMLRIEVLETNNQGPLMVLVNDETIYASNAEDMVEFEFSDDILSNKNIMEIKAGSPGWMFWASPEYTVNVEVHGLVKKSANKTFSLDKHRDATLKMFLLDEPRGELEIRLNNEQIYRGNTGEYMELSIDSGKFQDYNSIEFIPSHDAFFSIDYAELVFSK